MGEWKAREPTQKKTTIHALLQTAFGFYNRCGCFTTEELLATLTTPSHIVIYVYLCELSVVEVKKHISQTNKTILSDTTQGTSNHCFSSGSVQSKMSSLHVFPLPMPCRKAWRREKGNEEGGVWGVGGSLLNPRRAER